MSKADQVEHPEDCRKIQSVLTSHCGVTLPLTNCQHIWKEYSKKRGADWLQPITDDAILQARMAVVIAPIEGGR